MSVFPIRRRADDFEQRCAPYAGMVYRHCLHMLKNVHEAEDAAQETMLRAFRAYGDFRGDGVASWLYQIAHRVCLDVLKSARYRREHAVLDDPEKPYEAVDSARTPEESYLADAESRRLWDAVLTLPQEQQSTSMLISANTSATILKNFFIKTPSVSCRSV